MGDVVHINFPRETLPFVIIDALGNEAEAETAEGALLAAYTLQQDDWERAHCQGAGQQAVSIYHKGQLVLQVNRRIRPEEVPSRLPN